METKKIILSPQEYEQFMDLKARLQNSISPREVEFYTNELNDLIQIGRSRAVAKQPQPQY